MVIFWWALSWFVSRRKQIILWFRFRALKIFAVRYGLLLAYASRLTQGRRAPATRKFLRTLAKNFLMCAPAKP